MRTCKALQLQPEHVYSGSPVLHIFQGLALLFLQLQAYCMHQLRLLASGLCTRAGCLLPVLQGLEHIGRLLEPHGLSKAEAAELTRLNEDMAEMCAVTEAFDQSLTALLLGLVR
jgi:hypothetical protein